MEAFPEFQLIARGFLGLPPESRYHCLGKAISRIATNNVWTKSSFVSFIDVNLTFALDSQLLSCRFTFCDEI